MPNYKMVVECGNCKTHQTISIPQGTALSYTVQQIRIGCCYCGCTNARVNFTVVGRDNPANQLSEALQGDEVSLSDDDRKPAPPPSRGLGGALPIRRI